MVLSVSGSRNFDVSDGSDDSGSEQEDESENDIQGDLNDQYVVRRASEELRPVTNDNSVKLWEF